MTIESQNFLELPYGELEELNLQAKEQRMQRVPGGKIQEERLKYLTDEKRIKAVTLLFSDLEGRLHMLDYDKKWLVKSWDNMTFDGSSIRGFTAQKESDLRLNVDWSAFYWAPSDVLGAGKVMVFGEVIDKQGGPYTADLRAMLKEYSTQLYEKEGLTLNAANEIEGFVFKGVDAEKHYIETGKFEYVSTGGYYHSLPNDTLRLFIDKSAEVQRSMGFQNEKDHPEVAPSQFEINYGYSEAGSRCERQRHAHQCFGDEGWQESLLGSEGRGKDERILLEFCRPHSFARQRYLSPFKSERQRIPAAGSSF